MQSAPPPLENCSPVHNNNNNNGGEGERLPRKSLKGKFETLSGRKNCSALDFISQLAASTSPSPLFSAQLFHYIAQRWRRRRRRRRRRRLSQQKRQPGFPTRQRSEISSEMWFKTEETKRAHEGGRGESKLTPPKLFSFRPQLGKMRSE